MRGWRPSGHASSSLAFGTIRPCLVALAVLSSFLTASPADATTLVVYASREFVAIAVDGRSTVVAADGNATDAAESRKLALAGSRVAVATYELLRAEARRAAPDGEGDEAPVVYRYDWNDWIADVARRTPPAARATEFASALAREVDIQFADWDALLDAPALRTDPPRRELVGYYVAGIERGAGRVFHLTLPIERGDPPRLAEARLVRVFDGENRFRIFLAGARDAAWRALRKPRSDEAACLARTLPEVVEHMSRGRRPLLTEREALDLLRYLVELEASRSPDVALPITVAIARRDRPDWTWETFDASRWIGGEAATCPGD